MTIIPHNKACGQVIAFIDEHPKAMALLRIARLRAQENASEWAVVYIQTQYAEVNDSQKQPEWIAHILEQAEKMGAQNMICLEAPTIEAGFAKVMEAVKTEPSLLIIGNRNSSKLESSWSHVVQYAHKHNIQVEIVPLSKQHYRPSFNEKYQTGKLYYIALSLFCVALAFCGAWLLDYTLPPALFRINTQNVGLLFMIACAFSASRYGLLPSLIASIASFFVLNYYFTIPYQSFKFDNITDMLNLLLFLSAAVLISFFTSQMRGYAKRAARREINTQALFTLYRVASNATSRMQALEEMQINLTRMLAMDVAFFLPPALNPDDIELVCPTNFTLSPMEAEALKMCWKNMKVTGLASPLNPTIAWRFEPMIAQGGEIGVFGVKPHKQSQLDAWFGSLLTAIADQTASVLEHMGLEKTMEATRIREEREKLRSMLLSSVSHDLRTPLASMIGALSIYRSHGAKLSQEKRETLIETALEESERLDNFITNILNMTHLESGKIEFKKEWYDFNTLVQHVIKRMEYRMRQHTITINGTHEKNEVMLDVMMTEQVIQNVLDNATKYTKPGTPIEMDFNARDDGSFFCTIRDYGAGIPAEKLNIIFDKYARLQKRDMQIAGTGLGLAICKTVMENQGGAIIAGNHPGGGALFTLRFQKWRRHDATQYTG